MDLRHLRTFRTIFEKGGVSEAARTMNISQPPVTRILHALEETLGFKLFWRERGRLVPTPEADVMYEEVVALLERLEKLEQKAEDVRTGRDGRLTISAGMSIGYTLLAPILKLFHVQYPEIPIQIATGTLRDQLFALERSDIDMFLTFNAPRKEGIRRIIIGEGNYVVILPLNHPLAAKSTVDLTELSTSEIISGSKGSPLRNEVESALEKVGGKISSVITAQSTSLVVALTSAGMGVSIIDQFTAEVFSGADIAIRPLSNPLRFQIQALIKSDQRLTAPQEYMLEKLREEIIKQPGN